ncbi:MAG: ferrochelatase [Parachlamydiales bacterium]|nr:ferrochelatase [Parachlamydiales bacterium]
MEPLIIVNFGGPRHLNEVYPFLKALLTDRDVIRTGLPKFLHHLLFTFIAKTRSKKVGEDYKLIGGGSPIYYDTENLATQLRSRLKRDVVCFHRYLPKTHGDFLKSIEQFKDKNPIVFPMFPQFTYATTGSIARYFIKNIPAQFTDNLQWIKSYPDHPKFVAAHAATIRDYCETHQIDLKNSVLLFSAHGLPQKYVDEGDVYLNECKQSFNAIKDIFPQCQAYLSFQSKFGKGEWIKPYTNDVCENPPKEWFGKTVLFIPLSFTSDHIETLFEIEQLYLPELKKVGIDARRVPALTLRLDWIQAIEYLIENTEKFSTTEDLVRKGS